MSGPASSRSTAPDAVTPWFVAIARAVPAAALAAVITFSADHSAALGLVTFGVFGLASGAVILVAALRWARAGVERGVLVVHGTLAMVAGAASIAVPGAGLPFLVFVVTSFAVVSGFLELYVGLRGRRTDSFARDRIFLGGLTVLLAIAVLLVPPGLAQAFTGPDGVARQLTASVVVVGLLGAYWAIAAVFLAIGGLSLKWGPQVPPVPAKAKGA
ncbi:MAG: hypothetical protein ABJA94_02065 [Rhodoglobus sp.]